MIVCHCQVVSDRQIAEAVGAGARSVGGVCRTTGAGQDCGSCVFSVKRLVCEHGAALESRALSRSTLPEVSREAS